MIKTIGADLVKIERIEEALNKNLKFLKKNFTKKEIDFFDSKNLSPETVAANFAAKEAVSKAFGTGVNGFELIEIEVLRNKVGTPYIVLHGNAKKIKEELGIKKVLVSLSHTKEYALAYVVTEK